MLKKYKKIYSLAHQARYRNYTVRDLLELKGKKKLTQINGDVKYLPAILHHQ